jgi:hypothetical protein
MGPALSAPVLTKLCPACSAQVLRGQSSAQVDIIRIVGPVEMESKNGEVPVLIRRIGPSQGRSRRVALSPPPRKA